MPDWYVVVRFVEDLTLACVRFASLSRKLIPSGIALFVNQNSEKKQVVQLYKGSYEDCHEFMALTIENDKVLNIAGRIQSSKGTSPFQRETDEEHYSDDLKDSFSGTSPFQRETDEKHYSDDLKDSFSDSGSEYNAEKSIDSLASESQAYDSDQECLAEEAVKETTKGRRKEHFCKFCKQLVKNFARHITTKHQSEDIIQKLLSQPKKDPARRRMLAQIRGEGDLEFNEHSNKKIVSRISYKKNVQHLPCPTCSNLFSARNLYKHNKICGNLQGKGLRKKASALSLKRGDKRETLSEKCLREKILSGMRDEDAKKTIIGDSLLSLYGAKLCRKYMATSDRHLNMVRGKLRLLVKVLNQAKLKDSKILTSEKLLTTSHWETFLASVKEVVGTEKNSNMRAPSTVTHIGNEFIKLATFLRSQQMLQEKSTTAVESWILLYKDNFEDEIGYVSRQVRAQKNWEKPKWLPLTSDLVAFIKKVESTQEGSLKKIKKNGFSQIHFENLNKSTLVKILSFNKKRVGEVDKLKVSDVLRATKITKNEDIWDQLAESEKCLANKYLHVNIRGKLGRPVPLLIDNIDQEAFDVILKYRGQAGVANTNPFIFARGDDFIKGNPVVAEFANSCGAEEPRRITATNMRKYLATTCHSMKMGEIECDALHNFMGHTEKTHRLFYRQPDDVTHITKLTKVLHAINSGNADKYRGVDINDIIVNDPIDDEAQPPESPTSTIRPSTSTQNILENEWATDSEDSEHTPKKKRRHNIKRITWSTPEKKALKSFFGPGVFNCQEKLPSIKKCEEAQTKFKVLQCRSGPQIKVFIHNQRKSANKKKSQD